MIKNINKNKEKCKASSINVSGKTFDMRGNVISSTKMGTNQDKGGNPMVMALRAMKNKHKKHKK